MPKSKLLFSQFFLLFLVTGLGKSKVVERNYAISIHGLQKLIGYEHDLLNTLQDFTDSLQQRVDTIESYLEMMQYEDDVQFPTNPIESFRVMRRLHSDYSNLLWLLKEQPWEDFATKTNALAGLLPTSKDIHEARKGLTVIQGTYSILADQMARGVLQNVHHNTSLNAMECFTIAEDLVRDEDYSAAMEWLDVGAKMYLADRENQDLYTHLGFPLASYYELLAEIQDALGSRVFAMTQLESAMEYWPGEVSLGRVHSRLQMNIRIGKEPERKEEKRVLEKDKVYRDCCTAECRPNSKLFCVYNTTASYFLRLAPLKTELLSLDPYVVLYHDVASEKNIRHLKNLAHGDLVRAVTYRSDGSQQEDPHRTTKGAWLENPDGVVQRMTQLIGDMTNFDMEDSEPFEVMNYGIGGYYHIHHDSLSEQKAKIEYVSDRLATVIFYLSEVPQGGATVFPQLKLSVFPKKGSALVWYNLDHKGDGDKRADHSACPTIVGSRWAMTKWIGERGQIFRKPCLKYI
ncbi:prolyl 4-hydroxylase subunit alpha-2 [Drosophila ficusphila]|uniref:prolyl 4-hydroxylase subunit alpha-2 n=1 Tax=Drosophila ficusphila TaxID=30025 RepID=UPI0007E727BD|nr:prolyl 4-hydroxylase subunit alpha-2 [Drosophila ficusphila]